MHVCVCMHVCACMHVHACVCVCVCVLAHACVFVFLCVVGFQHSTTGTDEQAIFKKIKKINTHTKMVQFNMLVPGF